MTWIDWIIAAFVLFGAFQGLRRGLLSAVIGLLAVLIAYLAASIWYHPAGAFVQRTLRLDAPWAAVTAFTAILLVAYGVVSAIAMTSFGFRNPSGLSRVLGLAVGAVKGGLLATALLIVALASPSAEPIRRDVDRSAVTPAIVSMYHAGLRAAAQVLPSTLQPFGVEETARF